MSKITITILGTTAGAPTKNRGHSACHVSYDDGDEVSFLFDCGEGTQRQIMKAGLNLMKLDHIFISHWHGDHSFGLPGLADTMAFEGRTRDLMVYAPEARNVRKALAFSHSIGKFRVVPREAPSKGRKITRLLSLERFHVDSTPGLHSAPSVAFALVEEEKSSIDKEKALRLGLPGEGEIYGRLISDGKVKIGDRLVSLEEVSVKKKGKKIVYSGDTKICDNLKGLARDADLLIQDCTYFNESEEEQEYAHASLPAIVDMVRSSGVKRTILTHISRRYQDIGALREMVKGYAGFEVAEDFMQVVI